MWRVSIILLGLLALTACVSDSDRRYREAVTRYYQSIATGEPLAPATGIMTTTPPRSNTPKTYAIYDCYGRFQGTVKERPY